MLRFPDFRFNLKRADRASARALLGAGPWLWPGDRTPALEASLGIASAPEARPGQALVVSCDPEGGHGDLWMVGVEQPSGLHATEFGDVAVEAHRQATVAVVESLPVLWRSLQHVSRQVPRRACLLDRHTSAFNALLPDQLDGPSLGLALGLAQVSLVLELPIPSNVVASATLDASGRLGPVDGLSIKIKALLEGALGRTGRRLRLLVHPDNKAQALHEARGRLDVVPLSSLSQAIQKLWGDDLGARLLQSVQPPERSEFVEALFQLALGDRAASPVWKPIANTAALALGWEALGEGHRWRLEAVRAIALRHDGEGLSGVAWPFGIKLEELPQPDRLNLVAHLIQQATTDPAVPVDEALALGSKHLVCGLDAFGEHLKVLGAMGRLRAVSGEPLRGLEDQREAARGWSRRRQGLALSYPLSEWFRLAVALDDGELAPSCRQEWLQEAEELFARCELLSSGRVSEYLIMARAQARLSIDVWPTEYSVAEALAQLWRLWEMRGERFYLRWLAGRALLRHHRPSGADERVQGLLEIFRTDPGEDDRHNNRRAYLSLSRLDHALDGGGAVAEVQQALDEFMNYRGGLCRRLLDAAEGLGIDALVDQASYLRRLYPY